MVSHLPEMSSETTITYALTKKKWSSQKKDKQHKTKTQKI